MSGEARDALVEPVLDKLPERRQGDIVNLVTFAPSELKDTPKTFGKFLLQAEFEDPSPSMLWETIVRSRARLSRFRAAGAARARRSRS